MSGLLRAFKPIVTPTRLSLFSYSSKARMSDVANPNKGVLSPSTSAVCFTPTNLSQLAVLSPL